MNFSKSTLKTFQEAVDRFLIAEAQALETWQGNCHCPDPGLQLKCQKCPYFIELVLEIQQKLQPESEKKFPRILPLELEVPYSEELLQQCLELYSRKYSLAQIQRLTGITNREVLRGWLNSNGLLKKSSDYSQAEKQAYLALYKEGLTPKQIEDATGVSVELIYDWITQVGISQKYNNSYYRPEQKEECLSLYVKGSSCGEIEALTEIPRGTVRKWVKEANLEREPRKTGRPPKYSPEVRQACLELVAQGKSLSQIEEKMNITPGTIRRWLREAERLTQDPANYPVLDSDGKDF